MAKGFELPPEARALLTQVAELEARLHGLRDEFNGDVARARAGIEVELRRLLDAQQAATAGDRADAPSASHISEMQDRSTTTAAPVGAENAAVQSLREQVALLESRRDALLEEGRRRLDAERQEMIELFATRERQQAATAQAAEKRLHERAANKAALLDDKQAALERDRAAFSAANGGRTFQLTGLLAEAWADYESLQARLLAEELAQRPAVRAAESVRDKGRELAKARRRAVQAEWVARLYEGQVPWLPELRDLEEEQAYVEMGDDPPSEPDTETDGEPNCEIDPARRWLTAEEWRRLSTRERNQRALDRYFAGRRTSWQLGRDYERYLGYLRETEGFRVTYQGMIAGLEDMGRDLIALRGDEVEVIQCKRWSQRKTIHEKHLFQLYGTFVYAALDYPDKHITASFVTTTSLSDLARRVAEHLGVRVFERFPIGDYPAIKCNIGRDGDRIYHLPFDQQYDNTIVHRERGELWAATVAEAEASGFRRAYRWRQSR